MQQDEPRQPVEGPGDYEYDEAHDAFSQGSASQGWEGKERQPTDVHIPAEDEEGDYSYDLAHDVPPAEPPH